MEVIETNEASLAAMEQKCDKRIAETEEVIAKAKRDISRAERRIADTTKRLDEIRGKSGLLLIPARNGAAEAKREFDALRDEEARLEQDIRDDGEVISRLAAYVESFSRQLAKLQWESKRIALIE